MLKIDGMYRCGFGCMTAYSFGNVCLCYEVKRILEGGQCHSGANQMFQAELIGWGKKRYVLVSFWLMQRGLPVRLNRRFDLNRQENMRREKSGMGVSAGLWAS